MDFMKGCMLHHDGLNDLSSNSLCTDLGSESMDGTKSKRWTVSGSLVDSVPPRLVRRGNSNLTFYDTLKRARQSPQEMHGAECPFSKILCLVVC